MNDEVAVVVRVLDTVDVSDEVLVDVGLDVYGSRKISSVRY